MAEPEPQTDDMCCPGCGKSAPQLFTLLRLPRAPDECRCCERCLPALLEDGWKSVFSVGKSETGGNGVGARCWICRSLTISFHVVSRTGAPVMLERCGRCTEALKSDGWRAAVVHSVI